MYGLDICEMIEFKLTDWLATYSIKHLYLSTLHEFYVDIFQNRMSIWQLRQFCLSAYINENM